MMNRIFFYDFFNLKLYINELLARINSIKREIKNMNDILY